MTPKELSQLLHGVTRAALAGSFSIWCSRNRNPGPTEQAKSPRDRQCSTERHASVDRQLPHHHPPEATGLPGSSLSSVVVAADGAGISPNMGEELSGSTSDSSPEEVVRPR